MVYSFSVAVVDAMVDTMVDAMVGVVVVAMQWLIQWLMQSNGSGAPIVIQNCVGPKKVQYLLPSIIVLAQKGTVPLTFDHCAGPKKVQYLLPSIVAPRCGLFLQWYTVHDGVYHTALG